MLELVDTHCHIQSVGLSQGERTTRELWNKSSDLSAEIIVDSAVQEGVTKMICVGCDLADSRLVIEFVNEKPNCWASIGLHPHEAQHYSGKNAKLDEFTKLSKEKKVIAIGECGLDYFYEHSPKFDQIEILKFQIELALERDLPVIFHVRDAFDDFWPLFDNYKGVRGVLHSFTDNQANLEKAVERNLYIGVNGIATFTKNPEQIEVYKSVPLKLLLLETDAPFLTPTPYRGTINQPKRVVQIAEFIAGIRDENLENLAAVTTDNARHLFGI